jgi:hypothetical protein
MSPRNTSKLGVRRQGRGVWPSRETVEALDVSAETSSRPPGVPPHLGTDAPFHPAHLRVVPAADPARLAAVLGATPVVVAKDFDRERVRIRRVLARAAEIAVHPPPHPAQIPSGNSGHLTDFVGGAAGRIRPAFERPGLRGRTADEQSAEGEDGGQASSADVGPRQTGTPRGNRSHGTPRTQGDDSAEATPDLSGGSAASSGPADPLRNESRGSSPLESFERTRKVQPDDAFHAQFILAHSQHHVTAPADESCPRWQSD